MAKRTVIRTKQDARTPGVTYQLEWILCGKRKCKKLHGPYWYAYWKTANRTRTRYVGKRFKIIDRAGSYVTGSSTEQQAVT